MMVLGILNSFLILKGILTRFTIYNGICHTFLCFFGFYSFKEVILFLEFLSQISLLFSNAFCISIEMTKWFAFSNLLM